MQRPCHLRLCLLLPTACVVRVALLCLESTGDGFALPFPVDGAVYTNNVEGLDTNEEKQDNTMTHWNET